MFKISVWVLVLVWLCLGLLASSLVAMVASTDKLVTVEFKDADIHKVVEQLAKVGNLNVFIDQNMPHNKITLSLKDVPVDDALRMVCEVGGVDLVRSDNIYRIEPFRFASTGMSAMPGFTKEVAPTTILPGMSGFPKVVTPTTILVQFKIYALVAVKEVSVKALQGEKPGVIEAAPQWRLIIAPKVSTQEGKSATISTLDRRVWNYKIEVTPKLVKDNKIELSGKILATIVTMGRIIGEMSWSMEQKGLTLAEGEPEIFGYLPAKAKDEELAHLVLVSAMRQTPVSIMGGFGVGPGWSWGDIPIYKMPSISTVRCLVTCPNCGKQLSLEYQTSQPPLCPDCKMPLSADWQFCPKCGKKIEKKVTQEWQYCPYCGKEIKIDAKALMLPEMPKFIEPIEPQAGRRIR